MKHTALLIAAALSACGKSDDEFKSEVTAAMHVSIATELTELAASARTLQSAAPAHAWDATTDAAAIAAMKTAWRDTRVSYEHIEGALAPIFPDFDASMDARYDDYLTELAPAGDANLFDGEGATGMHAIERIVFSADIRTEVIDFESPLPGYRAAAYPTTDAEAMAFKTQLVQRLVDDAEALAAQWQPAAIDIGAAYQGLVGLMNEQAEKVNKAATGEEESRYADVTLFDLRNNLEGTRRVYELFRPWIAERDGGSADAQILAHLDALAQLYAGHAGDALPPVPAMWSSDNPTAADLTTPFGVMWDRVHQEVDPNTDGSVVFEMNEIADLLGFPEFVEG